MPLPDSRSLVWKWIALGASLCAFFGGLILAVIFLHAYVVPYRTEGGFIKQEQCIVESIENISIADQGGGLCTFGYSYDCRFCTVVLTRYRSKIEKVWVVGHLYHDVMVLLGRQTKAENKCGCMACEVDNYLQTGCILTPEYQTLCPGQSFTCYVSDSFTEKNKLLLEIGLHVFVKSSIMHSVAWPTVFFIGGFVGIVFTWICFEKQAKAERRMSEIGRFHEEKCVTL